MLRKKVLSGISWMSGLSFCMIIIQVLKLVILARLLSPSEFGEMAVLMLIIGFVSTFSDLGLGMAIVQNAELTRKQFSSIYWIGLIIAITGLIIINLAGIQLHHIYEIEDFQIKLSILSTCLFLKSIGYQYQFLYQKDMNFKMISQINIICEFSGLFTVIFLAFNDFGVWALVWGLITTNLIYSSLMFYFGSKNFFRPTLTLGFKDIAQLVSFGLFQSGERLVNFLSVNFDKIFISKYLGIDQLGIYNIFWQIIMLPLSKINPIANSVAYPAYAILKSDKSALSESYANNVKILSCISMPLLLFVCYYGKLVVAVVLGEVWVEHATILQVLALVGLSKALSNPGGALLLAIGRADLGFWWNTFWAICNLLAIYFAIYYSPSLMSVALALVGLSLSVGLIWHYMLTEVANVKYYPILTFLLRIFLVSSALILFLDLCLTNFGIANPFISLIFLVFTYATAGIVYLYFFETNLRHIVLGTGQSKS